jgi:hypothetical protein
MVWTRRKLLRTATLAGAADFKSSQRRGGFVAAAKRVQGSLLLKVNVRENRTRRDFIRQNKMSATLCNPRMNMMAVPRTVVSAPRHSNDTNLPSTTSMSTNIPGGDATSIDEYI